MISLILTATVPVDIRSASCFFLSLSFILLRLTFTQPKWRLYFAPYLLSTMPANKHKALEPAERLVLPKLPLASPESEKKRRRDPKQYGSTLEGLKDQLMSCLPFHKISTDRDFPFKAVQLKDTTYRIEVCESEHINIVGTLWEHDMLEEKEVHFWPHRADASRLLLYWHASL